MTRWRAARRHHFGFNASRQPGKPEPGVTHEDPQPIEWHPHGVDRVPLGVGARASTQMAIGAPPPESWRVRPRLDGPPPPAPPGRRRLSGAARLGPICQCKWRPNQRSRGGDVARDPAPTEPAAAGRRAPRRQNRHAPLPATALRPTPGNRPVQQPTRRKQRIRRGQCGLKSGASLRRSSTRGRRFEPRAEAVHQTIPII
jgi:hypothetical protein